MSSNPVDDLVEQCDDWEEKISEHNLAVLCKLLTAGSKNDGSVSRQQTVRLLQLVADLARADDNRAALSAPEIVTAVGSLYRQFVDESLAAVTADSIPDGVLQCTRAAGNLCYFNAGNRAALAVAGVAPLVAAVLVAAARHDNGLLLRVAAGVVANLAYENDDVQETLRLPDIHKVLFAAHLSTDDEVDTVARAVTNLLQSPRQWPTLSDSGCFDRLAELMRSPGPLRLRAASLLTTVFNEAAKDDAARLAQLLAVRHNFVAALLPALTSPSDAERQAEAVELAKQAELPHFATRPPLERQIVGLLLAKLAECESPDVVALFVARWSDLFAVVDSAGSGDIIALRCAALTVGYLGFHSTDVRQLIADQLPRFLAQLDAQQLSDTDDNHSGDTDVQMGLIMSVAVVVDGPERVQQLIDLNGHQLLLRFLSQRYDPRVVHQALGVLRNMSIPPPHKQLLVRCGAVPLINQVLEHSRDVTILYSAVVALRSLLAVRDNAEHLAAIVDAVPVVPTLLSLWERHWQPGTERVLWEAARALASLVVHGRADAWRAHGAVDKPLAALLCSSYAQLRQEGWAAALKLAEQWPAPNPLVAVLNAVDAEQQPSLEDVASAGDAALLLLLDALASPDCTLTVRQLNLRRAALTDAVFPALRDFVASPRGVSLVSVDIEGNHFSDANTSALQSILQSRIAS